GSGAGRAGSARPSSSSSTRWRARCSCSSRSSRRGPPPGLFSSPPPGENQSVVIFLGFPAPFAVKAPLWPFHGWLPDAYRESPPEVAAVLSGVVSKAAAYGFLRIVIPVFPGPTKDWQWLLLTLAAVTLIYGSMIAFRAPDVRGVVAYSS